MNGDGGRLIGPSTTNSEAGIRWFGTDGCSQAALAGGKGANLSRLTAAGLPVPPGFVVCAEAFARVIDQAGGARSINAGINELLKGADADRADDLSRIGARIRRAIHEAPLPGDLEHALLAAYQRLSNGRPLPVAVRSSAIAEDSPTASYAGQQETWLNVIGVGPVIEHVRRCWASFFHGHAMFYRQHLGSLTDTGIAVVVQRMVVPEKSGVLFTVDPVQRRRDRLVVEATWGFGEALVSGLVTPDNYQIDRASGEVLRAFVPPKSIALIGASDRNGLIQIEVPAERRTARVLDEAEITGLVRLGLQVEQFFGAPQDIEWAIADGAIFLLQSRPITTLSSASRGGRG